MLKYLLLVAALLPLAAHAQTAPTYDTSSVAVTPDGAMAAAGQGTGYGALYVAGGTVAAVGLCAAFCPLGGSNSNGTGGTVQGTNGTSGTTGTTGTTH